MARDLKKLCAFRSWVLTFSDLYSKEEFLVSRQLNIIKKRNENLGNEELRYCCTLAKISTGCKKNYSAMGGTCNTHGKSIGREHLGETLAYDGR
jgi:hypothetical protein